ncbi:hypothetical protein BDW62DRAFT_204988 [Aspergillus aurantiobrunneus]
MYWTTTTLSLLSLLATTTQALQIPRIVTTFTPTCHPDSQIPGDLDLNEEFSVSLNIRPGVCQGIPVPLSLGFYNEVDHASVALKVDDRYTLARQAQTSRVAGGAGTTSEQAHKSLEICTVRLFERPGCFDTPLIRHEFGAGIGGESHCVERNPRYFGLAEMFARVDCSDAGRTHGNSTVFGGNSTNSTAGAGGNSTGTVPGRWQQRRLSLVGR